MEEERREVGSATDSFGDGLCDSPDSKFDGQVASSDKDVCCCGRSPSSGKDFFDFGAKGDLLNNAFRRSMSGVSI